MHPASGMAESLSATDEDDGKTLERLQEGLFLRRKALWG